MATAPDGSGKIASSRVFSQAPPPTNRPSIVRWREVASYFFRLGWTAFGGPAAHIAMMREELVRRRRWVSEERFLDLLGLANIIPGPSSTELAIYLGYERAGWVGLVLAGTLFVLPAMLLVLLFAWAYTRLGALPAVGWVFYGIKPVVIAVILNALIGLARTAVKNWQLASIGVLSFGFYLLTGNAIVPIFGSGALAVLLGARRRLRDGRKQRGSRGLLFSLPLLNPQHAVNAWRGTNLGSKLVAFASAAAPAVGLIPLFLVFLKIGAVTYGSGYTLLAFLRADLVERTHWLTSQQLLDAVAVGQFTPGPVFTTATFIGFVVAGLPGALVATLGIFLPSFVLVSLVYPLGVRIRRSPLASSFLDGVNVAAVALIAAVLLQLGQPALVDWLTVALAVLALVVLLRFRVNSAWLLLGGALVGAGVHLLRLPM